MTLLLTESFDFLTSGNGTGGNGVLPADKWNILNTLTVWVGQTPRTGGWNADGATSQGIIHQCVAANEHATFIQGVAVRCTGASTAKAMLTFRSDAGTTTHVYVATNSSDGTKLDVFRGDGTLLGTTATGALPGDSTYHYVEVKATLHDSTGAVTIKVDEATVLVLTGIDTKNGGTKTVFDSAGLIGMTSSYFFDDYYLCNGAGSVNNDFLGAVRIEVLQPNGNGNSSDFDGSDGNSTNNYQLVDDALPNPDTADYVDGPTTGDKDTYAFGDSAQPSGNSVKGVVVYAWAQKTDAGARGLDTVARLSATEATVTPAVALVNGVYHLLWGVYETKPAGGAWTVNDVNGSEFGQIAT